MASKSIKKEKDGGEILQEEVKPVTGRVLSRVNYPLSLKYNGEEIRLSPKGKAPGLRKELLGPLPQGAMFVPDN